MKKYQIQNGMVYTDRHCFEKGTVYITGERLADRAAYEAFSGEDTPLDASGCCVIPGLTDIHFHGCAGSDACDGTTDALRTIAEYEGRHGITTITPATMTVSENQLTAAAKACAEYCQEQQHAKTVGASTGSRAILAGLYLEGPFISASKKGAQNENHIRRPDPEWFRRLQNAAGGTIRTVALAPETEGALEFIRALSGSVTISLAHTAADYDTARLALQAGASQITHLYNAMPGFHHRNPGPIGAAAEDPHCMAELICDGIHVHPSAVRAAFRLFGDDRIILISDSLRACGMPDGEYELGGQRFTVRGKHAALPDGTLAGSVSNLMDCFRIAVKEMGIPLTSAVRAAAVNPAKAIGIYDKYGSLTPGKYANVVILDQEFSLRDVYIHGQRIASVY
ncbi:MAG: N-acetylglucosamine-6-phosphate deacetylase [Clostridiales bacterium]|nr:N-acetylglucosamine-6-phosphate deacetylase [Clostridiales bacterium]